MIKKLTPQDFIFMESEVVRFNNMMGNSVLDKSLLPTYQKISEEEVNGEGELIESYKKGGMLGVLDGLIDAFFTCGYWAILDDEPLSESVQWLEDDICVDDVIGGMTELQTLDALSDYVVSEGGSYHSQIYVCVLISHFQNKFDIMGAFNEVMSSNMSKYVLKGTVDIQEEIDYILSAGRYDNISVSEIESNGETYLAFKAGMDKQNNVIFDTPKLVKSRLFREPQLEQFVLILKENK